MPKDPSGRGIAHTRWATHGKVSDKNSHPHSSGGVTLVHNGIIDNYAAIESLLKEDGYCFASDTDTELAAALIDLEYKKCGSPQKAIFEAQKKLEGSFAFGIIFDDVSDKIYAIKRHSPLIAAISNRGAFISSDVTAILKHSCDVYRPSDGELLILSKNEITVQTEEGRIRLPKYEHVDQSADEITKNGYPHFMLKELFEIPNALRKTLSEYISSSLPCFDKINCYVQYSL